MDAVNGKRAGMAAGQDRRDRVLFPTRLVAALIIPFLVLAFAVLVPWPTDTRRLFAWDIRPTLSAMVLGSVYLGGAYYFLRVIRAAHWHAVAGGFVPVGTFASMMGVATILHWDKFIHTNVAFWLWIALYFSTPFIVFAAFIVNQREYRPVRGQELELSHAASLTIAAGGAAALVMSLFLFLFPARGAAIWPWHLTTLTAQVLGAIFALGLAGLGALRERRWSAARLLLQVAEFMLVLILIAAVRGHDQFDTSNMLTWVFAVGFVVTPAAIAVLYIKMETRARQSVELDR
jgi:hypothetical protein